MDPVDPARADRADRATEALESQRSEVRKLVAALATGAAAALDGRVSNAIGHWEGCDSVFPEGHRNFRYRASARIDAGSRVAGPLLAALASTMRDAGLTDPTPGERPGGRTVTATKGDVEIRFSELPAHGDYVLLDVSGPCLDVPGDQRDDWEGRPDPSPIVVP